MNYILNPKYHLYNDKNRIVLMANSDDGGEFVFIHPIHAIILSKFTGEMDETVIYSHLCDIFNCSEKEISQVIHPFLNNKEKVSIKFSGHTFTFPSKLLIRNRKNIIRTDLKSEEFYINPPFDFSTVRLNIPKTILLILNTQCYTDCCYCYADKQSKYIPMQTNDIIRLIREAWQIGIANFDLSGGEVLLHKDYDIILSELLANGYTPFISTKVPIAKSKIERLWEIGIRMIQISLDSINSELQKTNLNVQNDYVSLIKDTIEGLDKKGFDIIIKSTCTKETCTVENIRELIQYIETIKNLKRYTFTPLGYSHFKTLEWYHAHKPSINTLASIVDMVNEEKKGHYEILWDFGSIHYRHEYKNAEAFEERAVCSGNISNIVILPDGKVTICEELYWNENFIIGDASRQTIMEIWNSPKAYKLWNLSQSNMPSISACSSCSTFDSCRHKRGVCWKEVIAFYGKSQWLNPDPRCPKAPSLDNHNAMLMYERD